MSMMKVFAYYSPQNLQSKQNLAYIIGDSSSSVEHSMVGFFFFERS